eukprot:4073154-Amphidinium_carterae.1
MCTYVARHGSRAEEVTPGAHEQQTRLKLQYVRKHGGSGRRVYIMIRPTTSCQSICGALPAKGLNPGHRLWDRS